MRRVLRGAVGLAAVGVLAAAALPSSAAPFERELLGVRIWRGWSEVLHKYGQPTRIEIGAVTAPTTVQGQQMGSAGMPGMPGMPGGMTGYGAPSGYGPPMTMGGPGMMSPGMPMAPMGMMGPGSGGSLPGLPGMGPSGGGTALSPRTGGKLGAPGVMSPGAPPMAFGGGMMGPMGPMSRGMGTGGAMGMRNMPGMPAMPGMPGMGMGGGQQTQGGETEVTWIYERGSAANPLTYMFLFNKDGRVIQIQEFGYRGGGSTSRGIRLGDPVSKVYRLYGWPDSSDKSGNQLTLDYSRKAKVAFQLVNQGKGSVVVGITVALTELEGGR